MVEWPLRFRSNKEAYESWGGIPVSEQAVTMQIGDCSVCGENAHEKGQGVLKNPYVENGVMHGEVICIDCALADPEIDLDDE